MRIGIAQINTIVGDLAGNRQKIIAAYNQLAENGADFVLFPELAICGYPPRDLLLKRRFVPDVEESLLEIANHIGDIPALIGFVETSPSDSGRPFFNAAAWCQNGAIEEIGRKCLLPSHDVFEEGRYFEPGLKPSVIPFNGKKIGITIGGDIWSESPLPEHARISRRPAQHLRNEKVDLIINIAASPWYSNKQQIRRKIVADIARFCQCPLIFCNAIGGNDELIFDGSGFAITRDNRLLGSLPSFSEALQIIDTNSPPIAETDQTSSEIADIEAALILGLRDYATKSGFKKSLVGLSGGLDSAVVAALAVKAFGPEGLTGISLPSAISSEHSKTDALHLARNLGIRCETIPINGLVESAETALRPLFSNLPRDVAEENIQARARGLLLMALSNKWNALLLTTGNKSELSIGYTTLYGDMAGGLAVLSDLPKTRVFELARHINRDKEIIPVSTLTKPPSAELRPDQKDEDSLPPYPILDAILERYVEKGESSLDIIRAGYDETIVREIIRKVDLNEYKRKQSPPGLKISPRAFGIGRRLPIVQRYIS